METERLAQRIPNLTFEVGKCIPGVMYGILISRNTLGEWLVSYRTYEGTLHAEHGKSITEALRKMVKRLEEHGVIAAE